MLIETSVLVALVLAEPDAPRLQAVIEGAVHPLVGVHCVIEASCALQRERGAAADAELDELLDLLAIEIVELPIDAHPFARRAWSRYGKGVGRPGILNFGDCLVYGHAKALGLPVLAKGDDFARTDIDLVPY